MTQVLCNTVEEKWLGKYFSHFERNACISKWKSKGKNSENVQIIMKNILVEFNFCDIILSRQITSPNYQIVFKNTLQKDQCH